MNDAKFTPGPWHVDLHTNVMAHGGMVAFPGIAAGFDQKANARLIAAAPELLAMVEELKTHIAYGGDLHTSAEALIAKATGSTS